MKSSTLINQRPTDIAEMNKFYEEQKKVKLSTTLDGDTTMSAQPQFFKTGNGSTVKYAIPKVNDNTKIFKDAESLDLKNRFDADKEAYINILYKKTDMAKVKEKWKEEE